ncbi:MAG TPA: phosphatase PAP2 family protein [Longimicrobiaceae bacterium]|nr:phosphatase PAP2 family protein [Longimicrobiaceae bacterium]
MIKRYLEWLAGHFRGFYSAVGLFLIGGLGVALLALGLLALLAESMAAGLTQSADDAILVWVSQHTNTGLDALAIIGAALGSGVATWIALGIGTIVFWRSRHHYSVFILWAAILGGRLLNRTLKAAFGRARPTLVEGDLSFFGQTWSFPDSPSFPSGHAITSVVIFGTLAYLIARLEPSVRLRRLTLGIAVGMILLIGLSRIYLGVHYPSDVVAGWLVGFIWATFAAFGIEAVRYFRTRKPEVILEEKDLQKGVRPIQETLHSDNHT